MESYTVRVSNPIIGREVMKIDTDNRALAFVEAASLSRIHGLAEVYDDAGREIVRFRYGVEQTREQLS